MLFLFREYAIILTYQARVTFVPLFLGMAAMPFPLWSSNNTVDDSLASFTFTNKFGLLYGS